MAPFARPENVLKRVEELAAVGQDQAALELLYDTLTSKRMRNVNQSFLEPIVLQFVELAVDLRKGKILKDGLHQYKKIIQTTSVQSLDVVIKKLIDLTESKVYSAQQEASKIDAAAAQTDDLEATESPEDLLMATVSADQKSDRTDRELVIPWLRFLWEAYRTSLDISRNNSKLEPLYAHVARRAFSFCKAFNRKTDFRRLCELLRNHLQSAAQAPRAGSHQAPANPIDLNDAETLQRYLETRSEQLSVAVKLELWQEAFRSVEDVHTLLSLSKRPAKASTMANYYENLARIFLVSGNQLFHAAAWSRFFNLVVLSKSAPEAEIKRISSLLLLSTLAIPISNKDTDIADGDKHRTFRLTGLLNLTTPPTRQQLLKSAISKNILQYVRPDIAELYYILEADFHPFTVKARVSAFVQKVDKDPLYTPYFKSLYNVILTKLISQLSQIYETVKIPFVIDLVTLPKPLEYSPLEVTKFILKSCNKGEVSVKIDQDNGSITFQDDSCSSASQFLQPTPSDILQNKLANLSETLHSVIAKVDPNYLHWQQEQAAVAKQNAAAGVARENEIVLERLENIKSKLEGAETERIRKEEEALREKALRYQQELAAEKERLAEDQRKRDMDRIARERQAIQNEEKRKIAEDINSKGIIKVDVDDLGSLDTTDLKIMQLNQLAKQDKDLNERLRVIGRRMDHLERAYRLEEADLWRADAVAQAERDKKIYEVKKEASIKAAKQQYEERKALNVRLQRITEDYTAYKAIINSKKQKEFEALKLKNAKLLESEKQRRIEEVKAKREAEARRAAEEEERRKREEEQREKEEEERRKLAEKRANVYVPGALRQKRVVSEQPSESPVPARAPSSSTPRSDPFGGAAPVKSDPFGGAAPVKSNPFGGAAPVPTRAPAAKPDPFGRAAPVGTRTPSATYSRPNAYGAGAPASARTPSSTYSRQAAAGGAPRTDVYGAARGSQSPADRPTTPEPASGTRTPSTSGKWVPPSLAKRRAQ